MKASTIFLCSALSIALMALWSCGDSSSNTSSNTTPQPAKTIEVTATDSIKTLTLPDGSNVSLNRGSTVSYSESFDDTDRNVNLKGEAHFEVKKNTAKKFTVYAGNTRTTVVGTSFNLRAYENEEQVTLDVQEGQVEFAMLDSTAVESAVVAEEQVIYDKKQRRMAKKKRSKPMVKWWKGEMEELINDAEKEIKEIGKDIKDIFKK